MDLSGERRRVVHAIDRAVVGLVLAVAAYAIERALRRMSTTHERRHKLSAHIRLTIAPSHVGDEARGQHG
jgi:hypothetical protein